MKSGIFKISVLLFFCTCFFVPFGAFAQGWEWARSAGNGGYDNSNSVVADGLGNIYIAGNFSDSDIVFGSSLLVTVGNYDAFLTKYDSAGNVIWALREGGTGYDGAEAVATDALGNTYLTGFFYSKTMLVGATVLTNADTSGASGDLFVIKYNSSGTVIWANAYGGIKSDRPSSIATDRFGNAYVTGYFNSPSINFGAFTLENADTSGLTQDIFVVKYNASGDVVWAKRAGGVSGDFANGIATDYSGNVLVTGVFNSDTLVFGSCALANATGMDTSDLFVVKYDSAGTVTWALRAGGVGNDIASGVAADSNGNVYISGSFVSLSLAIDTTVLVNNGGSDLLVAKFNSAGGFLWAKSAGGTSDDYASSVTVDGSNQAWVTGFFFSPSFTLGATLLSDAGISTSDNFLAKYDTDGTVSMAKAVGGYNTDRAFSVACDQWAHTYITGAYNSPSVGFGTDTLTCGLGMDVYVAKYGIDPTSVPQIADRINKVLVAPNPATEYLSISSEDPITTIALCTLIGQVVFSKCYPSEPAVQVNVADLSAGIYLLTVNGRTVRKIIKE